MKTTGSLSTGQTIDVALNPVSYSLALAYRFFKLCGSVRADKSWLPAATCADAVAMVSVALRTVLTVRARFPLSINATKQILPTN